MIPVLAGEKTPGLLDGTILAPMVITLLSTIYSLTHGIYEVFPFLYFLPIILFVYFYPKRGVLFSLGISTVYSCSFTCQQFRP